MEKELNDFVGYCRKHIRGDEKGEAQVFLDRFFVALGYAEGWKGAGADCEFRIRDEKKRTTSFADLVWKKRVLIEMKKSGEDLGIHLQQASSYWMKLAGDRPQYIILCNFDEFWIYDFNKSIYEPVDVIRLEELPVRKTSFSFLLPHPTKPVFRKDREDVTVLAAEKVAAAFNSLKKRNINAEDALRYCLQCVVSMFAEDVGLLPDKIFTRIIDECAQYKTETIHDDKVPMSYDLIGNLFQAMNVPGITPVGKYEGVDYFNGGLFSKVILIELNEREVSMLEFAALKNWRNVNPAIFGSLFESGLEKGERHVLGAHYTHEIDIKKIVDPVIVQPWTEKIDGAETLDEYYDLLDELSKFKVLDPACGSGNFLFIAFKEMKLLEKKLLSIIRNKSTKREDGKRLQNFLNVYKFVTTDQFYGIDIKPFAVELAKVTLMVAKELSWLENKEAFDNKFKPLPLDNLDKNIICADALLDDDGKPRKWVEVDAIIGNPPYQSKNKMLSEFGGEYMNKLWAAYPDMNKYADFCAFWFYKAHQHLKENAFAGLVGTNSIRQNNSRESSLDYIVKNGGTIFNAVSTEPWSGEAAVHVSIVCWKKGKYLGEKFLYFTDKKDKIIAYKIPNINSSLSLQADVTSAKILLCNKKPKSCFQGQTHGHEGFLLSVKEVKKIIKENKKNSEILKPYLIGDELVGNIGSQPKRFVIDFTNKDMIEAAAYKELFKIVKDKVLPWRETKAKEQAEENKELLKKNPNASINKEYINQYTKWWRLRREKEDLIEILLKQSKYIACARVTQRPIFEFFDTDIRPNDKVMVFLFEDDYSFGIIQSNIHWKWFIEKCTTLGETPNYNTAAIWDTFPFPQTPTLKQIDKVAKGAKGLRDYRNKTMGDYKMSLRDLYRTMEQPGKNPLRDLHEVLDGAVMEAYGFDKTKDVLTQLLELNLAVAGKEEKGEVVESPGLPSFVKDSGKYVSEDCVRFEWE